MIGNLYIGLGGKYDGFIFLVEHLNDHLIFTFKFTKEGNYNTYHFLPPNCLGKTALINIGEL